MLGFPTLPEPKISAADNCGSSYTMSIEDSTISTTTDANYEHTRPRTTRMRTNWTFAWMGMSDADFKTLTDFYHQVGKFAAFSWKNPIDEKTYAVRFADGLSGWQYDYPTGWHGVLKFKEV